MYDCPLSYLLLSLPIFIFYELKLLGVLELGPILPVIKIHVMGFVFKDLLQSKYVQCV
jgi:hypothetical protein